VSEGSPANRAKVAARRARPPAGLDEFRAFYEIPDRAYFGFHLALSSRFFDKLVAGALRAEDGVTLSHWRVLSQLYLRDGMTVRRLAEHVAVDRADISRAVTQLERAGHVIRQTNAQDHRSPLLMLTDGGRALTTRLRHEVRQVLDALIADLPAQDIDAAERVLHTVTMRAFALLNDVAPPEEQ
jgi:DNA-binding MarR family transcriptional regulator